MERGASAAQSWVKQHEECAISKAEFQKNESLSTLDELLENIVE